MTFQTATEYCKAVEARLGWLPPGHVAPFRRYVIEAAKVKRKIASDPDLFTWRNLELALELCAREKHPVTPIGVFGFVKRAVEMGREQETDVEAAIQDAARIEGEKGDPDGWVTRFARAQGHYRLQALREWEAQQ